MVIDRERVKNTFAEYTSGYNATDPKIKLKIDHTYRVAELCELIARNLKLDEYETDVAWLTGMLHDVGRFEQIKRYNTFNDAQSVDHVKKLAKARGCKAIILDSGMPRKAAHTFYEKYGFEKSCYGFESFLE